MYDENLKRHVDNEDSVSGESKPAHLWSVMPSKNAS